MVSAMSHHAAFLQAITAAPEDDVSRLVYADWLDDHDESRRAEFIRLQCRLATMDECDPELPDLRDREWELLAVYRKRWQPGPDTVLGKYLHESCFVRGFFGRVSLPAEVLLEHGEELFRDHPLQELRLRDSTGRLSEIVGRPWIEGVSSLELPDGVVNRDELRALTTSPYLGGLRQLRMSVGTPEAVELLAAWPGMRHVTHLGIECSVPTPERTNWLRPLLDSQHLGQLVSLESGTVLSDPDVSLLANSHRLANLSYLRLAGSSEGFRILATSKRLSRLRHLVPRWSHGWGYNQVEWVPHLLSSPLMANLETLNLMTGPCSGPETFGTQAGEALAASPYLGRLCKLDLTQCGVGPEGAKAIASAKFGSLAELNLFNDKIGAEGMAALAASPHLASLRWVTLFGCALARAGIESMAGAATLAGLRYLDLGGNGLGLDEAKILAGSPHRARLRHLRLGLNNIGARGARVILQADNLAGLWTLDLSYSNMTDMTARDAAAKTPLRELRRLIVHHSGGGRKLTVDGERALAESPRLPHLLLIDRYGYFSDPPEYVSPIVLEQGKGHEL
jgi:uncharacterized protein (TIGR02996 family)